jgi:hypothetical protein
MANRGMTNNHDHFDPDDSFDEKTFQLELQVADPERRELAEQILKMVMRLAHERARNENVSFADAWEHIFDWEHMRADVYGSNRRLGKLAEKVHSALLKLADMRCDRPLPRPKWMRRASVPANTNIANGGQRAI